jgi:hypothetical protein
VALTRLVTLLLQVRKPDYGRIQAAITTAKHGAFGLGDIVPVGMIPDKPLGRPAFSTPANSHPSSDPCSQVTVTWVTVTCQSGDLDAESAQIEKDYSAKEAK